jgi:ABC-type multidrug transport system ATPase subunit
MPQKEKPDIYSIKVRNLTKKFGDITAVENISFSVKRGENIRISWNSGTGKTMW